jgi:hypothetical protein
MRLRPLQIVGLIAVVVFGGRLVWQLTEPKRDPFHLPGAIPMNVPAAPLPAAPPAAGVAGASTKSDLLAVGSNDAKDDLYCSGLIFAAHRASADTLSEEAQKRRAHVVALASAGVEKLIAAKAAGASETAAIADAHAAKAAEDFAAGTPRITLEVCQERAAALPQAQTEP